MADELNDCPFPPDDAAATVASRPGHAARPMDKLPTLQRNALCKIFDRPEFSPEEVASLGYRRLQQAEGIGQKGLSEIGNWLRAYGFELSQPGPENPARTPASKKTRMNIVSAVRLLRTHGYVVQPVGGGPDEAERPGRGGSPQLTVLPLRGGFTKGT